MFHPSISQDDHERNIRRHNLALRKLADAQQYDPEEFDGLVTSNLADVPNSELKWIWPGRLPVGKLSLIAGETGSGKSLVAADLAARVSSGRGWDEGKAENRPGGVLILSPRLEWKDILRPRLEAAGANAERILLFSDVVEHRGMFQTPFNVRFDLRTSRKLIGSLLDRLDEPRLVVIDSFSDFVSFVPPLRGLEPKELSGLLEHIRETAADRELAVVCTETFPGGLLFDRCRDSRRMAAGLEAAFQSVWGITRDPEENSDRLFLPIRNHLGNDRDGLRFRIEPAKGFAAVIEWGDPEETLSFAAANRAAIASQTSRNLSKTAWATEWVREFLKDGPRPSKEIFSAATEAGLTSKPVKSALRSVAVKSKQGQSGPWSWRLPENGQKPRD